MNRFASFFLILGLFVAFQACCDGGPSSSWFDRAPLNTETDFTGLTWYGLGRAYRYLAYLLNLAVLAGLLYGLGKPEVDYSYFLYVYFGILVGSFLLSVLLNPFLHIFSVVPITALVALLVARFCAVRPARALAVALLYQIYQVGYLLACKAIAARLS
jgi:hypothetical protein